MSTSPILAPIVDTHAHLDDEAFDGDRAEVMAASREAGVVRIINIGYRPESWRASLSLRETYEGVDFALGLHPQLADSFDQTLDEQLGRAIEEYRPVAIGETGLDFARNGPPFSDQERAFRRQIEMAQEAGLPLVIHQRASGDALMAELDRWPSLASIVLHSFDGDRRLTEWAIERDCYVGIGGLATRPGSHHLRELLGLVSPQRILLETDAPYLAPPNAPSRRNTPAQLAAIATILAPIWDISAEELRWQTTQNAGRVFGPGFT